MKNWQNEYTADRIIRFFVAIGAAFAACFYSHGTARSAWLIVAAIALISSLSGFSLFYRLIGINKTLKRQK